MVFNKVFDFVKKHSEIFTIIGLGIIFYLIFFFNIGNYALMDVDETRYVSMARDMFNTKDFMTLYLNGEYFFEKPPLYFWLECFSFGLFGKVNEFTARFPVAMCGTLICYLTYFMGKKVFSRTYGIVSSLILATSFEFVILAKFAILDIVVSACVAFSVMFGMITFFCRKDHKKFFVWLFYIFSGLAVMAKGLPGFIVPFGVIFFCLLITDKLKSAFKPKYFLVGMVMFLLIVLPWHIAMLHIHNPLFYEEYIIKHHLARFFGSDEIHRAEPFWFYFANLFWGLIPWTFSAIALIIAKIKGFDKKLLAKLADIKSFGKLKNVINSVKSFKFDELDNSRKFLLLNWIAAIFIMGFFTASGTKLITYILPIYIHLAFILGFAWTNYIEKSRYEKSIGISVKVWGILCVIVAFVALFTPLFLPQQIYQDILPAKWMSIGFVAFCGVGSLLCLWKNNRKGIFLTYVIFTMLISAFCTKEFFKIDYKFGQDDLMQFAAYAKQEGDELISFGDTRRYSLLYYSGYHINYIEQTTSDNLKEYLEGGNDLISIRKKYLDKYGQNIKYKIVMEGRKYVLLRGEE